MTVIDDIGTWVNWRKFTADYSGSDYDNSFDTGSDIGSVQAYVEVISDTDDYVKSGVLAGGDAVGFFNPSDNVDEEYEIHFQDAWFEVQSIDTQQIGNTKIIQESLMRRKKP